MPMTHETHINVLCSMLYERGAGAGHCKRLLYHAQIEKVVNRYNLIERTNIPVDDLFSVDQRRWSISHYDLDAYTITKKGGL